MVHTTIVMPREDGTNSHTYYITMEEIDELFSSTKKTVPDLKKKKTQSMHARNWSLEAVIEEDFSEINPIYANTYMEPRIRPRRRW